jgi:DNA ligase (NAD+)
MSPAEKKAKAEIKRLRAEIEELDRRYYQQARPALSDWEYDALRERLLMLERDYPQLAAAASPTVRVGSDLVEGARTRPHLQQMLSLDNSYSREELAGFDDRLRRVLSAEAAIRYLVEPKIDGLSISVRYDRGQLVQALTRGDGEVGEIVTDNFLQISGVPVRWPLPEVPECVELRGEVYMTYARFNEVNAERAAAGLELYANPRNLAAGTLKLKENTAEVARRGLSVIFYGVGEWRGDGRPETQQGLIELLRQGGWPTHAQTWQAATVDELWQAIAQLDALRRELPYPTDGAVIKLDSCALQAQAGSTARAPRWAFAYKYAPEQALTLMHKITLQVGRTGVLTPVAELSPVELSGSTVSRATLHNADEIARKDIREGDYVWVQKAGEVIPEVVRVELSRRPSGSVPYSFPCQCPSCGAMVVRLAGEVAMRCSGSDCPDQRKRALEHFAGRNAMAIDGLGEAVVAQLVERSLVRTAADLYRLSLAELLSLEGFAEKSALNLHGAIAASKRNDLWRLIHALGIPQVGVTVAELLARQFGSLQELRGATLERLEAIHGIGESMAQSICSFFDDKAVALWIDELVAAGGKYR